MYILNKRTDHDDDDDVSDLRESHSPSHRSLARPLTHACAGHNSTTAFQREGLKGREGGGDSGVIWAVINEPRDTHEHVAVRASEEAYYQTQSS